MDKLPVRLRRDPIVDCLIEMWFKPTSDAVTSVLPGILFSTFGSEFPETAQTDKAQLPQPMRVSNPGLARQPVVQLRGNDKAIGVGDTAIQVVHQRPYPGWSVVQPTAISILSKVLDSGVAECVERISIKYQNVLDVGRHASDLSQLKLKFELGSDLNIRQPGTNLRCEVLSDSGVTIVQILTDATARSGEKEMRGVLLSVDTISGGDIASESDLHTRLETIHKEERRVFFSLLTDETLQKLEPEWD